MSDQSAYTAEHIESLRVGSLSVGGTTVVRQLLSCEFPSQGVTKKSAILSTPLSIVDTVTQAKTPFQVPPNARIVGITVLPLDEPNPLCLPTRPKSALCMGFARCRKTNASTYGYKGDLYVPTYGGLEAQTVVGVAESGTGKDIKQTPTFCTTRTVPIDLTNIELTLPLAGFDYVSKPNVGTGTVLTAPLWPNAYHGLYRYLSPARMPATALANRSLGVTYENADVLLSSKKPQYFEWNSISSAESDETQNSFIQMHLSVWTFDRYVTTTPVPADVYGSAGTTPNLVAAATTAATTTAATTTAGTTTESDFSITLTTKVDVRVELVYELQSETPDSREKAYTR